MSSTAASFYITMKSLASAFLLAPTLALLTRLAFVLSLHSTTDYLSKRILAGLSNLAPLLVVTRIGTAESTAAQ